MFSTLRLLRRSSSISQCCHYLSVGLSAVADAVGLMLFRYVNPIALGKIGWKYYIVYDCWLLVELIFCYLFVVETKNHTLEETAVYVVPFPSYTCISLTLFCLQHLRRRGRRPARVQEGRCRFGSQ